MGRVLGGVLGVGCLGRVFACCVGCSVIGLGVGLVLGGWVVGRLVLSVVL